MLSESQSMIESALKRGGLSPDAATEAASAIVNCAAAITHRGPMTLDYTPQQFRYITPERRKYQFPSMDNLPSSPDYRPPVNEEPQYPDEVPEEPQSPRGEFGPSQPVAAGNINVTNNYTLYLQTSTGQYYAIPTQSRKVVTDIKVDKETGKVTIEYEKVWVLGFKKEVPKVLPGSTVRAIENLRVDAAALKLYGTINELAVFGSRQIDAVSIDLASCE